ncbi:MAG: hypothetical protein IZT60_09755, partial [Gammaproteobacteria bacterium]|nr:hypothetical protein [Gammaproteobacteria bacterium]
MTGEITVIKRRDESLRFLGNWHESIPRILFMDPFMNAYDRNVYCVIRALISEEGVAPHREMRFPDYSAIMKYGNIRSRATVAKAITAARIIGWIVQNNPSEGLARDKTSGRFKPKQWLFLDEPMPHSEICQYDHGFVAFIKQAAGRQDEHISDLAQRVLAALIDDHGSEQDETLYDRRIDAYETVKADSNTNPESQFFGISQKPADGNPDRPGFQEEENPPCTEYEHGRKSPSTVYEHGGKSPSTVNEHGKKPPSTEYEHGKLHQVGANSPSTVNE